jgi:hypothetical protein
MMAALPWKSGSMWPYSTTGYVIFGSLRGFSVLILPVSNR